MSPWLDTLAKLAPTVATAIGGPFGGIAVSTLESVFGIGADSSGKKPDVVGTLKTAIEQGQMTAEQLAKVKQAEIDLKEFMAKNEVDLEDIAAKDRESARQMQISQPSIVPAGLSVFITAGFFAALGAMLAGLDATDNNAFLIMLGALSAAMTQVLNYWFGSTRHSQNTATLNAQAVATAAGK